MVEDSSKDRNLASVECSNRPTAKLFSLRLGSFIFLLSNFRFFRNFHPTGCVDRSSLSVVYQPGLASSMDMKD